MYIVISINSRNISKTNFIYIKLFCSLQEDKNNMMTTDFDFYVIIII
jgi:hypothetical protein